MFEDDFYVTKVRRFLPETKERPKRLIQFWAREGGQRTVAVRDIIDY